MILDGWTWGDRAFFRLWICGDLNFVSDAIPMSTLVRPTVRIADDQVRFRWNVGAYHNNNALDSVPECLITALFPILS